MAIFLIVEVIVKVHLHKILWFYIYGGYDVDKVLIKVSKKVWKIDGKSHVIKMCNAIKCIRDYVYYIITKYFGCSKSIY